MALWLGLAIALIALLLLELGLRQILGLGCPLLYQADAEIGYLLAPNQQTRRLGKRIAINEYSMRSPSITASRPAATQRLLLVGDSVANGSWWTDQQATISAQIQTQLAVNGQAVEVLNASANSWCPRNEVAYLRRFGTFDAQAIALLINTDDLFGTAPTSIQVGVDRNYPDRRPPLALVEAYQRYVAKAPDVPGFAAVLAERGDRVGFNLQAIAEIQQIAQQAGAKVLLAMTPLLRELGDPGPRDYEVKARQRLQAFTEAQSLPYLDFLPLFLQDTEPARFFRDRIHLNDAGNERVATALAQWLQRAIATHDG
ncbi:MAG: SGNH/GDSL hydrolase family protein [Spirulinaceae cyanobacterium SM2_1_0]|nr:SGNH/GDSL hydrolase family protein [Spirulinaceae cyanobacterium SM2_1_0]